MNIVLASVLCLVVLKQEPLMGPLIPPGVDAHFMATAVEVEGRLEASDFVGASRAAERLPKSHISIGWDESGIPLNLRAQFAKERDQAMGEWRAIAHEEIAVSNTEADIEFGFAPSLPVSKDDGLPAGAAFLWNDAGQGNLKVTVALQRGNPLAAIDPANVHNEVAYAIGCYLGLGKAPYPSTFMGRTNLDFHQTFPPSGQEGAKLSEVAQITATLRDAIHSQKRLVPTRPQLALDPNSIDMGTIIQGDPAKFSIHLRNTGNSPLSIEFAPDCGCVVTDRSRIVPAGTTFDLEGTYDTTLRVGDTRHQLVVTCNDRETPVLKVPIHVNVKPRYRLLVAGGPVIKLPESGTDVTAYLLVPQGYQTEAQGAKVLGVPGTASLEKWSGQLADPELEEPEQERQGYKVKVHLTGETPRPGRSSVTLWVGTNDPRMQTVTSSFFVQRGIVVLPDQLYMGEVGAGKVTYSILITGPSNSFHIKSVSSSWPHLSVGVFPNADGTEYRIQAVYDGLAKKGHVTGSLRVQTDDPKQASISVPISAEVR